MPIPPATSAAASPEWECIAIVGVGLMGGSIGLDLLRRGLARQVVGIGRRSESLRAAEQVGCCTSTTLDLAEGVKRAQLVIVCTPVSRIVADVREAATQVRPDTLITDVGSTKAAIVDQLDRELPTTARYVGSHPLAGSERTGAAAATPNLLVGRTVVVTPGARPRAADGAAIRAFWESLGAKVVEMSPAEHDRRLASSSHLPHVVAAALAAATPRESLPLVAGGWIDTTRIAGGDPELWRDILLSNRKNVLDALQSFETSWGEFRQALVDEDPQALADVLRKAKQTRDALGN